MPSKIKIDIRAQLRHPSGKIIKTFPWVKANSLLKAFIQNLAAQISQAQQTITDTGGTNRAVTPHASIPSLNAAAANTVFGILIGTGTTAVTMTDFKLQTPLITNVAHGVVTFAVENPDASTYRIAIARVFTNNTGATAGIREVALYTIHTQWNWYFCIDRTLYSVDVPGGIAVTLTYRITISL